MNKTIRRATLRATWVIGVLLAMLQAPLSQALGLGEINVNSRLNERFDATIQINSDTRVDNAQLIISLASAEDFQRAGIDRLYMLTRLKFELVYRNGQNYIEVTSPDVLREPYLSFLIEARWPAGRLLKEYTVLLDLPNTRSDVAADVAASSEPPATDSAMPDGATVASVPPGRQSAPASPPASRKPVGQSAASLLPKVSSLAPAASQPVSREPALAVKPSVANDIDEPTAEIAPQQVAEVSEPEVSSASLPAIAPEPVVSSDVVASDEQLDNEVAQLQAELAKSLENLDKAELENAELEQRIDVVESQVDDFEKLVALKTQELDAVQNSIEEKQQQLQNQSDAPVDQLNTTTDKSESAASQDAPLAAAPTSTSTPVSTSTTTSGTIAGLSYSLLILIAGGLAVLILLVVLVARLLRGSDDRAQQSAPAVFDVDESFDVDENHVHDELDNVADEPLAAEELAETLDQSWQDDVGVSDQALAEHDISTHGETDVLAGGVDDSQEEPIADADIYMTYGRHEQAISALKHAIDKEPGRADLRLKLLEVIQDQGSLDDNTYLVEAQKQHILDIDPGLAGELNEVLGQSTNESVANIDDTTLSLDVELDDTLQIDTVAAESDQAALSDAVDNQQLSEEVQTKLELASTYFEMGDFNGARDILQEVIEEGSPAQQDEAQQILKKLA